MFMKKITGKVLQLGGADLPVGQDAQQRVPAVLHLFCI